ncbi:MAG: hypothetical protein PHH09_13020 [Methanoregulaceae archaeon]|nr:hypothetical protein [Methanoregulaceae archaeon]
MTPPPLMINPYCPVCPFAWQVCRQVKEIDRRLVVLEVTVSAHGHETNTTPPGWRPYHDTLPRV